MEVSWARLDRSDLKLACVGMLERTKRRKPVEEMQEGAESQRREIYSLIDYG